MKTLPETKKIIDKMCREGNLNLLIELLNSNKKIREYVITDGFDQAIIYGQLNIIEYLLTVPNLKTDIHYNNDYPIRISCHYGHLDSVKFLLTSPLLKEKSNLLANEGESFIWAAEGNHLPVVKFLLNFPIDPHHISTITGQSAFMASCDQNAIDCIKFISKLDKFNMKSALCSINKDGKDGFQLACENHEHDFDIVEYIVMELGFKPDKRQQQYMIDNMDNDVVAFAHKLLSTKSLHEKLDKQILDNYRPTTKLKI